jgi:hypothetical protein
MMFQSDLLCEQSSRNAPEHRHMLMCRAVPCHLLPAAYRNGPLCSGRAVVSWGRHEYVTGSPIRNLIDQETTRWTDLRPIHPTTFHVCHEKKVESLLFLLQVAGFGWLLLLVVAAGCCC